jgi:hypothetical protein
MTHQPRLKLVADTRIDEEQVVVEVSNDGDERSDMAIGCPYPTACSHDNPV